MVDVFLTGGQTGFNLQHAIWSQVPPGLIPDTDPGVSTEYHEVWPQNKTPLNARVITQEIYNLLTYYLIYVNKNIQTPS